MARTSIRTDASPERVFDILADAGAYPHWVVGAKQVRAVEEGWPAPGTAFHHSVGAGPASLDDATTVVELDPPRRLVLRGRARPFGTMTIVLDVSRAEDETEITITERPASGPPSWLRGPSAWAMDVLIHVRNIESLRRLRRLAEANAT
jgi:uncharacterized protein YndB with AHSA1/START domain